MMRIGKLSMEELTVHVLRHFPKPIRPPLDAATFDKKYIVSHDPSIGMPIETLGFFAFHYTASDVAAKFGIPRYMVIGIYMPINYTNKDIEIIAEGIGGEAGKYGVEIIAGHTGFYKGFRSPFVSSTCIGEKIREEGTLAVGDKVIQIGIIGLEAVWLRELFGEGESKIDYRKLTPLDNILSLHNIREIKLIHDVGEGGIATALYELCINKEIGIAIDTSKLIVYEELINYERDISFMPSYGALIAVADDNVDISKLPRPAAVIGKVTEDGSLKIDDRVITSLKRTGFDELYGEFV
jgi:hydrogenase maturation factor